jgi:carboxymethylenebutenolidase
MTDIDLTDLASAHGGSKRPRGYLASPTGVGPWPGVVMLHEIFGLNDVMRLHADRLAALGYLTLAVDLFSAGGTARCLVSTMVAMVRGQGRAFADIAAARESLATTADCTGRIGVIGFCMGGSFALLSAKAGYDAAAINYGQLPRNLDAALRGTCPIVGSYGRRDPSLRRAASRLEAALHLGGQSRVQEGQGHRDHFRRGLRAVHEVPDRLRRPVPPGLYRCLPVHLRKGLIQPNGAMCCRTKGGQFVEIALRSVRRRSTKGG